MLTDAEFRACGASRIGRVSTRDIVFSDEVRQLCAQNVCRSYGATWACPPGVGEVAACREKCLSFENGIARSPMSYLRKQIIKKAYFNQSKQGE